MVGLYWNESYGSKMGKCGLDSSGSDREQWRVHMNTLMNLRVPLQAGNFLTSWAIISFWRSTLLCGVSWLVS